MALYDTPRTTRGSFILAGLLASAVTSLFASVMAWNDARATRNALSRLSDRELEDIGLHRGEIELVAEGRLPR